MSADALALAERAADIERAAKVVGDGEIRELARIVRDLAYQVNANHYQMQSRTDPRLFDPNTR
jgi:hypothetical protein